MVDCCPCCSDAKAEDYALDAAGQKVHVGDYVLASLPNVPATRRLRTLHPCQVTRVSRDGFQLIYVGDDRHLQKWTREPFMRWRREVVKADLSFYGLGDGESTSPVCCSCPYKKMECYGN